MSSTSEVEDIFTAKPPRTPRGKRNLTNLINLTNLTNLDVAVPMRDGVTLRADVWRPAADGRFPALIFRTPYSKTEGDPHNERMFRRAVERGYAVVVQDVRGRYRSEGEFDPYRQEGPDGYDTVEWAAAQPWADGNVGMFGLSYPGAAQWLAAVEAPPHLKAIVPAMTFATVRRFICFGGVFDLSWTRWSSIHIAPDIRARKGLPGPKTAEEARQAWDRLGDDALLGCLPLLDLPDLQEAAAYYYEWIRHAPHEPYWDWGDLVRRYGNVQAAVLNLSGWHDEPYGVEGAISNYSGLLAARSGQLDPRTRLVIGPWTHGVAATESTHAGARTFGPSAAIDYDALVLDWLDCHVRDVATARSKPVRVYVMGADRWRESDVWPLAETCYTPIHLARADVAGELSWQPARGAARSSFISNPATPVRDPFDTNFGSFDLAFLSQRPDVLAFDSPVLAEDLEVTGPIVAEVFASSDGPDFDLYVMLLDVCPDGRAFNLMSAGVGLQRASARDGAGSERTDKSAPYATVAAGFGNPARAPRGDELAGHTPKLLVPGQVVKLVFDQLCTSNLFQAGHRLRVCLLGSWFPTYPRNLQTGASESVSAAMRQATITIHHDARYLSRLMLPVIPAAS